VTVAADKFGSVHRTPAQTRILVAALELFAEHGVSATSLQMIADALGVTKAAVYHKFKTKEEIAIAVTEMQLARLESVLQEAEASDDRLPAREQLLEHVIAMAVDQRRMVGVLENDPVIVRLLAEHQPFQRFLERLYAALIGDDAGPELLVRAAMVTGAIASAVKHPLVASLDDETLQFHLLDLTKRLVGLPAAPLSTTQSARTRNRKGSARPAHKAKRPSH
jgi:AcrR family transcriptional regulator